MDDRIYDVDIELTAVRYTLEMIGAVSLAALGMRPEDVAETLHKRAVRGIGSTILPGVDPTINAIAIADIAECVDGIFSGIEEKMVPMFQEPPPT